ncbi:aquaporin [Streptantibioticus ferralitis]|uniref:Aquaporin n=1 Tax=Streptantibioticus ferralitis TaxID=236510 RepID=A0ABT5Z6Y3_9ACTN|nr:aquaporin [Streptantibioticus ferralitis]MDF2259580.1 aquaporin [Streptantibioticus ferralitis]
MRKQAITCEFLGTLLLVFFAVGSVVLAGEYVGTLGTALAFGFVLLALTGSFGAISGCHVNPAVTLGMVCAGRMDPRTAAGYWTAQFAGGIVGATLLFVVAKQVPGLRIKGAFGSNGYGSRSPVGINIAGAFLAEMALTFLLVFVVLAVARRSTVVGFAGVPVAMALAVVHLVGIPLTGTSVNPARSLGPAIFAGGAALSQVWLFVAAPLVGGALAAAVHRLTQLSPAASEPEPEPELEAGPGPEAAPEAEAGVAPVRAR